MFLRVLTSITVSLATGSYIDFGYDLFVVVVMGLGLVDVEVVVGLGLEDVVVVVGLGVVAIVRRVVLVMVVGIGVVYVVVVMSSTLS